MARFSAPPLEAWRHADCRVSSTTTRQVEHLIRHARRWSLTTSAVPSGSVDEVLVALSGVDGPPPRTSWPVGPGRAGEDGPRLPRHAQWQDPVELEFTVEDSCGGLLSTQIWPPSARHHWTPRSRDRRGLHRHRTVPPVERPGTSGVSLSATGSVPSTGSTPSLWPPTRSWPTGTHGHRLRRDAERVRQCPRADAPDRFPHGSPQARADRTKRAGGDQEHVLGTFNVAEACGWPAWSAWCSSPPTRPSPLQRHGRHQVAL